MGIIKTTKRIIFLIALVYLLNYAWPHLDTYFPDSKEKITGFATQNIITPALSIFSEKAESLKNDVIGNKQIVISLTNSTSIK